ncbi:MAG: sugar ABC transporter ATP-binding protein [Phycisphaerales bacterium]|nr:sugar ABC transporter ATP-binding protein [Phycisphaerales bacterium]
MADQLTGQPVAHPPPTPLLEMRSVTKTFPGVAALDRVDFTLRAGEIHALMGENGAGKSTLIKVLTGIHARDGGDILLAGKPVEPHSTIQAQKLGISTVYQEINLIPELSVAENVFLGRQPMKLGAIRWRSIRRGAEAALARLDLSIDVTRPLISYSMAIQQMVAIARALDVSARILILDEPTSSLDENEVTQLFRVMRRLKDGGLGIVFITHFIDQVYDVADRITVLRNGRLVGAYETAELPRIELIAKMIGRSVSDESAAEAHRETEADSTAKQPFVQVRGLGRRGAIAPFDLDIFPGEVVGMAGLLGSGRTEAARLIFGLDRADAGTMRIGGEPAKRTSVRRAIARGFGFLPEDRGRQGLVPDLSLRENIILALQAKRGWLRTLSRARQTEIAERFIKTLNIDTTDTDKPIRLLSGGNQQKAILARWLATEPALLILDEPTRGIDVGAKAEIQRLIARLRRDGMAILFISSELEEVVQSSGRVMVLRDRVKVAELCGEDVNEGRIMHTIAEAHVA